MGAVTVTRGGGFERTRRERRGLEWCREPCVRARARVLAKRKFGVVIEWLVPHLIVPVTVTRARGCARHLRRALCSAARPFATRSRPRAATERRRLVPDAPACCRSPAARDRSNPYICCMCLIPQASQSVPVPLFPTSSSQPPAPFAPLVHTRTRRFTAPRCVQHPKETPGFGRRLCSINDTCTELEYFSATSILLSRWRAPDRWYIGAREAASVTRLHSKRGLRASLSARRVQLRFPPPHLAPRRGQTRVEGRGQWAPSEGAARFSYLTVSRPLCAEARAVPAWGASCRMKFNLQPKFVYLQLCTPTHSAGCGLRARDVGSGVPPAAAGSFPPPHRAPRSPTNAAGKTLARGPPSIQLQTILRCCCIHVPLTFVGGSNSAHEPTHGAEHRAAKVDAARVSSS